jgi:HPt (histidine-containing phosphotransfer) domain-containing protein
MDNMDRLRGIEGINAEIGLGHVSGLADVYLKTVEIFTQKIKPECEKMRAFLAAGDMQNFTVSIHGMKSSLATVGATKLSDAAYKMEMAARDGDSAFCDEKYQGFADGMEKLHGQLSPLMPLAGGAPERAGKGAPGYFKEVAGEASAYIKDFDLDAAFLAVNKLLALDFGEQLNRLAERASEALNDFDFDAASEHLGNALRIIV